MPAPDPATNKYGVTSDLSKHTIFHAAIRSGKFHGMICPQTEIHEISVWFRFHTSDGFMSSVAEALAIRRECLSNNLITPSCIVTNTGGCCSHVALCLRPCQRIEVDDKCATSLSGFPLSRDSSAASSSRFASMRSASLNIIRPLLEAGNLPHVVSKAVRAAFTAYPVKKNTQTSVPSRHPPCLLPQLEQSLFLHNKSIQQ